MKKKINQTFFYWNNILAFFTIYIIKLINIKNKIFDKHFGFANNSDLFFWNEKDQQNWKKKIDNIKEELSDKIEKKKLIVNQVKQNQITHEIFQEILSPNNGISPLSEQDQKNFFTLMDIYSLAVNHEAYFIQREVEQIKEQLNKIELINQNLPCSPMIWSTYCSEKEKTEKMRAIYTLPDTFPYVRFHNGDFTLQIIASPMQPFSIPKSIPYFSETSCPLRKDDLMKDVRKLLTISNSREISQGRSKEETFWDYKLPNPSDKWDILDPTGADNYALHWVLGTGWLDNNPNFFEQMATDNYYDEYKYFLLYIVIAACLTFVMSFAARFFGSYTTIFSYVRPGTQTYECGFAPFENISNSTLFLFYKLAVFFVIFEAELIFLVPWTVAINANIVYSDHSFFVSSCFFIFILFYGFAVEIKKDALEMLLYLIFFLII